MVKCGLFMKKKLDYFTTLLERAPAGWALIRANEIKALEKIKFKHPILDVGCGDGLVARLILKNQDSKFDWGIDISRREIEKAKRSKSYKKCMVADVYNLPFPNEIFKAVFSNSVIEHLKLLDRALSESYRVLKPGGELVITVPSSFLATYLLGSHFFLFLGLNSLAKLYGRFFHFLARHHNVYNHKQWREILKKHKFELVDYFYYHTPAIIQTYEVLSYIAIPQHIVRLISGSWPLFTRLRRVIIVPWLKLLFSGLYKKNDISKIEGGSLLLITKKL